MNILVRLRMFLQEQKANIFLAFHMLHIRSLGFCFQHTEWHDPIWTWTARLSTIFYCSWMHLILSTVFILILCVIATHVCDLFYMRGRWHLFMCMLVGCPKVNSNATVIHLKFQVCVCNFILLQCYMRKMYKERLRAQSLSYSCYILLIVCF